MKVVYLFSIVCLVLVHGKAPEEHILTTPGCTIPSYKVIYSDDVQHPQCGHRLVELLKVGEGHKMRFIMRKQFTSCCYRVMDSYSTNDELSACHTFENNTFINVTHDFIHVECSKYLDVVYRDVYAVTSKVNVEGKLNKKSCPSCYNVIILGLEAVSRARAYNSLPETVDYMLKSGFLDYRAYNRISAKTLPNLLTILTGDQKLQGDSTILSAFQKAGYITAVGENGFNQPYFNNILFNSTHNISQIMPFEREVNGSLCLGRITSAETILNYLTDFIQTYRQERIFSFFWMKSFRNKSPLFLDRLLLKFLKDLTPILNDTFVFLISDLGVQKGWVRLQVDSFYEARLPMLFLNLPNRFSEEYTYKSDHAFKNQYRLVTPYDVYLSVNEILNNKSLMTTPQCKQCKSIFRRISYLRNCNEVFIDESSCACHTLKNIEVSDRQAEKAVIFATKYVTKIAKTIPTTFCAICKELYLKYIINIYKYGSNYHRFNFVTAILNTDALVEFVVERHITNHTYKYDVIYFDGILIKNKTSSMCVADDRESYKDICECNLDPRDKCAMLFAKNVLNDTNRWKLPKKKIP